MRLSGKTALITGAARGIGRGISEAFGALGARIIGAEIDPQRAADTQTALREAGIEAEIHVCDVRETAQVKALVADIGARIGGIDTLVNNVGDSIGEFMHPFDRAEEQFWDALYAINLRHVFTVSQAALPLLRQRGIGGAAATLRSREEGFVDRDLYVFVVDREGRYVLHGAKPAMEGHRVHELPGIDGDRFVRDAWAAAPSNGGHGGWIEYDIFNAETGKVQPKASFMVQLDDRHVVGCGIYRVLASAMA